MPDLVVPSGTTERNENRAPEINTPSVEDDDTQHEFNSFQFWKPVSSLFNQLYIANLFSYVNYFPYFQMEHQVELDLVIEPGTSGETLPINDMVQPIVSSWFEQIFKK